MILESRRALLLVTSALILTAYVRPALASPGDVLAVAKPAESTSHLSQAVPTAAAPTSQAVPTATPPSAVPVPTQTQVRLRTIFDFEKELELNDTQVQQLHEAVEVLTAKLNKNQVTLNELAANLTSLIRKNAEDTDVKPVLDKISDLQIDGQLTDIRTSRQINVILTPQQKERWIGIQIGDRAHFTK